jgi:hypothetical protein
MTPTKNLILQLKSHVKKISGKTAEKAILDMARALAGCLNESGIDYKTYISDYNNDDIFNPECFLGNHSNIFDFVKHNKYDEFCRVMFEVRPVGLGTPNAMVGEGEFMALFCSPRVGISKKKGAGDITVNGKTVELKGTSLRFMCPTKITGKQVQKHAQQIAAKYNVVPNLSKGNRTAFEPWGEGNSSKLNKINHWVSQFGNMGEEKSKKYLNELCGIFMPCTKDDFNVCFSNGKFDYAKLQFLIVQKFFNGMEKKWDFFTQVNDGKIVCISDDQTKFNKLIIEGKLVMDGNYFRSFQDTTVGFYVKLK